MDDFVKTICPSCGRRVIDRSVDACGKIRIKCPHCKLTVVIDLSQLNQSQNSEQ